MPSAVLSLGTNIGNKLQNLSEARQQLLNLPGSLLKASSVYETAPWGNSQQALFYNQVIEIETDLTPDELMEGILNIEQKMGRIRMKKWEPRIIDIDILFYNDEVIERENLHIPHQHLHERKFILEPLKEILPDLLHPVLNLTTSELLSRLQDELKVEKLKPVSKL